MAILIVAIGVSVGMTLSYNKTLKQRVEVEELNRELYAVTQELKYNYTIEEIIEKSENKKIQINKEDDLLEKLLKSNLFDINNGEGIVITINDISEDIIKINVVIEDEINGIKYKVENEFNKSRWMHEI